MKIESSNRLDRVGFSNNNRFGDIRDVENGPSILKPLGGQLNQPMELGEGEGETLDENLGEDFEVSRWLPPSIEKAAEFRKENVYRCSSPISLSALLDYVVIWYLIWYFTKSHFLFNWSTQI